MDIIVAILSFLGVFFGTGTPSDAVLNANQDKVNGLMNDSSFMQRVTRNESGVVVINTIEVD